MNSSKRNLLKDYVYTITHYLPQKQKAEVSTDIEATLYELLLEQFGEKEYSDQEIETVIRAFGQPRLVAERYLNQKPSLIASELLETYWFVVKIALIGSNIGVFIARMLTQGLGFISILGGMINLSLSVFGMVTLIFILVNQKLDAYEQNDLEEWSLKDLKVWKEDKHRVSRFEIAFESIFLIFFIQAFFLNDAILSKWSDFNSFVFGVFVGLSLVMNLYLLIKAYWTPRTRILSILLNLIFVYLSMQFLINLPEILSTSMLNMEGVQISIRITAGILILIVAWDIYEQLRHLLNK